LPDSPSFPNRWMFGGGGLAAGMAIGFGIGLWLEMRDKSVRTEEDVVAILGLPVLSQVPWVRVEEAEKNGNVAGRLRQLREEKNEEIEV
jgi:capsular polysaccharide biosynthesis protein